MQRRLRSYIVPFIVLVTVLLLARFPLADCFDCEGPSPWGRNDASYHLRSNILSAWLFGISFLLGIFRVRWAWLVAPLIAVGDFLTEHLGGVTWWSLFNNEGPSILILDCLIGLVGLVLGRFVIFVVSKARERYRNV